MYGERTEAVELLVVSSQKQYLSYLDKNSLYPAVCMLPVHPWQIPGKHHYISEDLKVYFDIAHFRILLQQNIMNPVLPQKIKNQCFLTLCHLCAENRYKSACRLPDIDRISMKSRPRQSYWGSKAGLQNFANIWNLTLSRSGRSILQLHKYLHESQMQILDGRRIFRTVDEKTAYSAKKSARDGIIICDDSF